MDKAFFLGEASAIQLDGVVAYKREGTKVEVFTISGEAIELVGEDADKFVEDYVSRARKVNAVAKYQYEYSDTHKVVEMYEEESKLIKPANGLRF